jgi:hypothetical protein
VRPVYLLCPLLAAMAGEHIQWEAPGQELRSGGVLVAPGGFIARMDDRLLSGAAARYDQPNDLLWASGDIVYVMGQVRIHAARIGLRPNARTGDAWEVEAWVQAGGSERTLRIRADWVELRADRITFRGVRADAGHGGAAALHCPVLHLYLREQQRTDKGADQIDRYVEGIAAVRPYISLAGVPVLWMPYLYRDYVLDYPWTSIEAGTAKRQGWWARYRIGTKLPEFAGWRTRVVGRVERNTRAGNGYGLEGWWRHERLGRGSAVWYRMEDERVSDPADQDVHAARRSAESYDIEHYAGGDRWAAALRYAAIPDADPSLTLAASRSPDERFRADFLKEDLENKPFARRGAQVAWRLPGVVLVADTERRVNSAISETERWLGLEAVVPRLALAGPIGVEGSAWVEDLHRELADVHAVRTTWDGRLALAHWMGGVGVTGSAGGRGRWYEDGRIAGVDLDSGVMRWRPEAELAVRLRTTAQWGAVRHTVEPRVGLQILGRGRGDQEVNRFAFGDERDTFEEDRRFAVTGFDSDLSGAGRGFTLNAEARWALRRDDRLVQQNGVWYEGGTGLADVRVHAQGRPHPDATLTADGTYDARPDRWTAFDTDVRWRIRERVEPYYQASLVPGYDVQPDRWQHRPGLGVLANRYRLDGWLKIVPAAEGVAHSRSVDAWGVELRRRMVDGLLTVAFEETWSEDGQLDDRRVTLGFVLFGSEDAHGPRIGRGYGFAR